MNGTNRDDSGCQSPETSGIAPNCPSNAAFDGPQHFSVCASCGKQITDPFILRVNPNLEFHAGCLKCYSCDRELDETCTTFVRNGQTFCRDDYLRLFGRQCSRCRNAFEKHDMVMRARNLVFHIPCFSCFSCRAPLRPGEQFLIKGEELYCQRECATAGSNAVGTNQEQLHFFDDSKEFKQSPTQSVKSPDGLSTSSTPSSLCAPLMPPQFTNLALQNTRSSMSSSSNNSSTSKKSKKDKPSTRVRTVLTDQQLRILKQMYSTNTRPDAVTKENLVEMTGLSPRVIRVWFQNKRCKDKKRQTAMKEAQRTAEKEQALHGVRINGIGPLIAESATTDISLGMNPIAIHQYPQNSNLWASNDGSSPDMVPPPPYMMMNHGNNCGEMPPDYGSYNGYMTNVPANDYSSLSSPCSD